MLKYFIANDVKILSRQCRVLQASRSLASRCTGMPHRSSHISSSVPLHGQKRNHSIISGHNVMKQRVGARDIQFSSGKIALLADGSVVVESGETIVLVTAVSLVKESELRDFLPLQVDFRERSSALGRIPTTHARRDPGSTDREILVSRMIDRAIRPLFQKGYHFDTQILSTLLSADAQVDPDVLCLNGASLALCVSDIPWQGPLGAVRIGYVNGQFIVNPSKDERQNSQLDVVVAGYDGKILMLEAGANEVSPDIFLSAIEHAQTEIQNLITIQKEFALKYGKKKRQAKLWMPSQELQSAAVSVSLDQFNTVLTNFSLGKHERELALADIRTTAKERLRSVFPDTSKGEIASAIDDTEKIALRQLVLSHGRRCDGRTLEEIRPLDAAISVLPDIVHGSSFFERGRTQALCSVTLDHLDTALPSPSSPSKHFFVHYEFPPYAVSETGRVGRQGRRELGHGALAERALLPLLPSAETFPYTLRLVSEITSSNGSSSMATVCGGSLALMDAGVPITRAVAGITCGLVTNTDEEENHSSAVLLTDIAGIEDHLGDMDLKLAGTSAGITAVQLDVKIAGLSLSLLRKAIAQACRGRDALLSHMNSVMANARPALKTGAPKIASVPFNPLLRAALMGVGGSHLRQIERRTGAQLQVMDETQRVSIFSRTEEGLRAAKKMINAVAGELQFGMPYATTVTKVTDMGVYVMLDDYPGREAYLHVTECAVERRTRKLDEAFTVGEALQVRALGYDAKGRLLATMKEATVGTSAMLYGQLMSHQ